METARIVVRLRIGLGALALTAIFAQSAAAELVTYEYKGTLYLVTGEFAQLGQVGYEITGTFSFDDRLVDGLPLSDTYDSFGTIVEANQLFLESYRMTISGNGITFVQIATAGLGQGGGFSVEDTETADHFEFEVHSVPGFIGSGSDAGLECGDGVGDAISPGGGNLTSTIAGTIEILDRFNPTDCGFAYGRAMSIQDGGPIGSLQVTWTTNRRSAGDQLRIFRDSLVGVGPGSSLDDKADLASAYYSAWDVGATCAVLEVLV